MKGKLKLKWILTAAAVIAAAVIAAGLVRLHLAGRQAKQFASEQGINRIRYEGRTKAGSREELLTGIWHLAVWENEVRTKVDDAFLYDDEDFEKQGDALKTGFESKEELLTFAMKEKWRKLRNTIRTEVERILLLLMDRKDSAYELNLNVIRNCYYNGYFERIAKVMEAVERGAGMEAYDLASGNLKESWRAIPMDIAFGLRPKLIKAGCEASLINAEKSKDLYEVRNAVDRAEEFVRRYDVTIDGLESAKKREERLEYAERPEIPAVGMSLSRARSTKLGSPTRTTTEHGSWSHERHTYGDMYWDRGGKQIFRVHYSDGEVTDVYDSRYVTAKSPWTGSSGRSSGSASKKTFDPDDHDIEAYYEDNRDEYDNYDDAYEGFLDDEGVWDDY